MLLARERSHSLFLAHGGRADLHGKNNTWYNMLSARNISVNVLFRDADFHLTKPREQLVHGAYMASIVRAQRERELRGSTDENEMRAQATLTRLMAACAVSTVRVADGDGSYAFRARHHDQLQRHC